jgi:sulfotransferase famil protein
MTGIRQYFRDLEYSLPIDALRPLVRTVRNTPYQPEYEETHSIFVHIPKTAGTSVGEAIYGHWMGHVPLRRFAAFEPRKFKSFFKFSFVRNPWDRFLSAFAHLKGHGDPLAEREALWSKRFLSETETFEQFVLKLRDDGFRALILNDVHFRRQLDWITLPGNERVAVDYLGRFESLEEDYLQIARRLGVRSELPLRKRTKRPPYREAYSSEMHAIVENLFRSDISRLGYDF